MERWCGKVAVVTGASSGIGACITKQLVKAGLIVVGIARRVELVEALKKELPSNGKLYAKKVDITKEQEIIDAFQWINKNVGPIQILVNNAGLYQVTSLINGDSNAWKKILDTNVMALAIATKEAIKVMQEQNLEGHIININSIAGNRIRNSGHMYGPSKHACTAFSEILRHEITAARLHIKMTSIHPGAVETPMTNGDEVLQDIFKGRPKLDPEAVADVVSYVIATPQDVQITQLTIQPLFEPA